MIFTQKKPMKKAKFTQVEIDDFMRKNEEEITHLQDDITSSLRKIKTLQQEIRYYQERISLLETIKIEEKASKSVWKTIAIAAAAIGALIMSLFKSKEE
jgi:FtsZ-binding cell division protein ZapB